MAKLREPDHGPYIQGRSYQLSGDVTTIGSLGGKSRSQLEVDLGFEKGRLAKGYSVFQLEEGLANDDFIWGDQTRYSGRKQFLEVFWKSVSGYEAVDVNDLLRGDLLVYFNGDEAQVDALIASHRSEQQAQLNVRSGHYRIAKVRPVTEHIRGVSKYPDSPTHGIPQWTLRRAKWFRCIDIVGPGS